jgi:protein-disulfide isomerase
MHDQLYNHQPEWVAARNPEKKEREYAAKVGLDLGKFDECVGSNRYIERLRAEGFRASRRGINSTPTIVVGNTKIEGTAYDAIKRVIDSLSPPPKKS